MMVDTDRGKLLEALRLARGLTQVELARLAGTSQGKISKVERFGESADQDWWLKITAALNVPAEIIAVPPTLPADVRIFHRKRKSTPKKSIAKLEATIELLHSSISRLFKTAEVSLSKMSLEGGFVTPQEVASDMRQSLGISKGPIADLFEVIEMMGVYVLRWPLEEWKIDGLSSWPPGGQPLMLISNHISPERQRFTAAHELGHLVMHNREATPWEEREADAFASSFLMPKEAVKEDWPQSPDLVTLMTIKKKWGVSLSALIRTGYDANLLCDEDYKYLNIKMSMLGFQKSEPESMTQESPTQILKRIEALLSEGRSIEDLSRRTHMNSEEFEHLLVEVQK